MENELISIVVPIYNAEEYLERCIESITKQTYSNLEIILVNDGSTDNSGEICDKYVQIDHRISVIHKPNEGLSEARNSGLDKAKGAYIAFIDADDFIRNDFIEKLYDLIQENDAQIAVCNYERGTGNHFSENRKKACKIETYSSTEMLKNWHGKYKDYETVAWNKLYKKELFDKSGIRYPKDHRTSEDVRTTHLIVAKADKITITDEKLHYYYRNPYGITGKISIKKIKASQSAQQKRLAFFKENGYQQAYERLLIKLQKYYMLMYCRLNEKDLEAYKYKLKDNFLEQYAVVNNLETISTVEKILFWSFKHFYKLYGLVFKYIKK